MRMTWSVRWRMLVPSILALVLVPRPGFSQSGDEAAYDSLLKQAIQFSSAQKYEESASILERLTKEHADRAEPFLWLGRAQLELGNWAKARDSFTQYTQLAPEDFNGFLGLARAHRRAGNPGDAVAAYKQAVQLDPSNEVAKRELQETQQTLTSVVNPGAPGAAPPAAAATPSEDKRTGFWQKGIAGLCGARTVWWGWLIAGIIFGLGLIQSGAMAGVYAKAVAGQMGNPDSAGTLAFFYAGFGLAISYILFWGIPIDALGWVIMGVDCFIAAIIGAAVASN